jgi:hypothetical protein
MCKIPSQTLCRRLLAGDIGCFFEFSVAMFEVPSDESKSGIGFITDFIDIC